MLAVDLKENDPVVLRAPDGYTMKGIYERYVPAAQRYQFKIFIGGGHIGTTVLLSKATINKYSIEPTKERT